jgi:simple sugar transport system substrate-binding protein
VQLLKTKHIPDNVWKEVMDVRQQILDGKVKVEPVWDAAQVRPLMSSVEAPQQ